MNPNGDEEHVDEASLLPLIRRWWWLLLLGASLGGIGGLVAASVLPKTYSAEADLLVGPLNTDSGLDASGSLSATYQNLATSRQVLAAAIAATGAKKTVDALASNVTSSSNTITRIVSVHVDDGDRGLAAGLANAIAARLTVLANQLPTQAADQLQTFDSQPEITALSQTQHNAVDDRQSGGARNVAVEPQEVARGDPRRVGRPCARRPGRAAARAAHGCPHPLRAGGVIAPGHKIGAGTALCIG
jgi:capsular polysaccharide biosynthesis protein